jgi:hypothetical protein
MTRYSDLTLKLEWEKLTPKLLCWWQSRRLRRRSEKVNSISTTKPRTLSIMTLSMITYSIIKLRIKPFCNTQHKKHLDIMPLSLTFHLMLCCMYTRSATWSRIWNVPNEKDRCVIAIAEAITLLTSFILLIALHFRYVFMLICWSLYSCYPSLLRCSASHSFSLSLSVSPVVSSLSLFLRHTYKCMATFSVYHWLQ